MKAVVVITIVAVWAIVFACIYDNCRHPCIRSQEFPCIEQVCDLWMDAGSGLMCYGYSDQASTCSRCLERKP